MLCEIDIGISIFSEILSIHFRTSEVLLVYLKITVTNKSLDHNVFSKKQRRGVKRWI